MISPTAEKVTEEIATISKNYSKETLPQFINEVKSKFKVDISSSYYDNEKNCIVSVFQYETLTDTYPN